MDLHPPLFPRARSAFIATQSLEAGAAEAAASFSCATFAYAGGTYGPVRQRTHHKLYGTNMVYLNIVPSNNRQVYI